MDSGIETEGAGVAELVPPKSIREVVAKALKKVLVKQPENEEAIAQERFKKPTPKETELLSRAKERDQKIKGGNNQVFFIDLKDDGSAIFKPLEGEKGYLRTRVKRGSYYKRERAAYVVDRFLTLGLVPPTVIRDLDGKVGSLQEFVPDTNEIWAETPKAEELYALGIFDYIIWNSDRHDSNFLVKDGKIYAIDHGLSFGRDTLRVYQSFVGKQAPELLINALKEFLEDVSRQKLLREFLRELLPEKEIEACFARIEWIGKLLIEKGSIDSKKILVYLPF